jgi:hypothetical protein
MVRDTAEEAQTAVVSCDSIWGFVYFSPELARGSTPSAEVSPAEDRRESLGSSTLAIILEC